MVAAAIYAGPLQLHRACIKYKPSELDRALSEQGAEECRAQLHRAW